MTHQETYATPKTTICKGKGGVIVTQQGGGAVVVIDWEDWYEIVEDIKKGKYDPPPQANKKIAK